MADPALRADLRLAVHRLRSGERRRVFATAVHVGDLTGEAASWAEDVRTDDGLRTDVALELVERAVRAGHEHPAVWLTRTGMPEPHDADADWHGPLRRALDSAGIRERCLVVVTKAGWYDPVTGEQAVWQRLRIRRPGRAP